MTAAALFESPSRIVQYAMEDAGILQDGDDPTSEQLAKNMNRLKDMINFWQTQGLKLWLNVDTAVPLFAGQRDYTFGPTGTNVMVKPLRVVEAYYEITLAGAPNTRRPVTPLAWRDWVTLSQTDTEGQISQYFEDKQQVNLAISFWLTPDSIAASEGQAHLVFQTQVAQFTQLNDTMNFPLEWYMALRWGLADDICTGQPQTIMDRCKEKATMYRLALEDWDVEDAPTKFAPDMQQGGLTSSRFR